MIAKKHTCLAGLKSEATARELVETTDKLDAPFVLKMLLKKAATVDSPEELVRVLDLALP